jgi:hypothetical protein
MQAEPARLVFIDETSVKTNMCRLRGRSLCGTRLKATAPFGKWGTQTFIAGLRCDGLVAPWVVEGAINGAAFDIYVETQLAPLLAPGDVVILDNLNHHKNATVREWCADNAVELVFTPTYASWANPIEAHYVPLREFAIANGNFGGTVFEHLHAVFALTQRPETGHWCIDVDFRL